MLKIDIKATHQNKVNRQKGQRYMNFLNGLTKIEFLNEYWEKKPFVFRAVIDNPESLIELEEILEMSGDKFYESRCISKNKNEWKVEDGPFKEINLLNKNDHWTLINHNLDLYLENIFNLKQELRFLPTWLFDDAMSTYSTKGSSVGAHIDNYNVFILQLQGKREWEIEYKPNKAFEEGLEVKILKTFNPDESFILEPGDMIYIPPHIAHHGISQTESLSLSLGFKSLEDQKLVDQFALELLNSFDSNKFYKTQFDAPLTDPLLIDQKIITNLKERLLKNIANDEYIHNLILRHTSATKKPTDKLQISRSDFDNLFSENSLFLDEYVRFSASKFNNEYKVAINEAVFEVNHEEYLLLNQLSFKSAHEPINQKEYRLVSDILFELCEMGAVYFESAES